MNEQSPIIYLIDDDAAVRDALTLLLRQSGFSVESFDGAESFLAAFRPARSRVACAIVDLQMPGMNGAELQQALLARGSELPLIFLTAHGDIPATVRAMKAGASDFLTKPVTRASLLESLSVALETSCRLLGRKADQRDAASRLAGLSPREREVATLAVQGLTSKEIGKQLNISYRTVEIHRARVMAKSNAASLVELANLLFESSKAAATAIPPSTPQAELPVAIKR